MRKCWRVWTALGTGATFLFLLAGILIVGCEKGTDEPAGATVDGDKAVFANARCPIMGSPIDPAKVPDALVRTHKGHKIAFCCASCPKAWDRLSGAEKDGKLAAAEADTSGHGEHGAGPAESHQHDSHH